MTNKYLRRATATLAMAAVFGVASSSPSPAALIMPATQIDAYGYAGTAAATSDTGSLVAVAPSNHSTRKTEATFSNPAHGFWMPSVKSPNLLSTTDLQMRSLYSLYQLARLTTPAQPHLDVTLFGGGLASQDYYLTDEGIQLEQSITEGLGLVGRATGYQLWIEKNSTSPLAPSNQTVNRLNFGRFQAGFDLSPLEGFNFVLLGGHDVGDSDAWTIESDISMWFLLSSAHPVNLFIAPVHNFQNDVTSSEIDIRVVALQTHDWILLLGAGGQVFGGGFINGIDGEGGPIVGIYNRLYQIGADLQFGYGSPGVYGELSLYKTFSIPGL
jgi:hypothetical protein